MYFFRFDGAQWQQEMEFLVTDGVAGDLFGVSSGLDGERALVSAPFDDALMGAAYIFAPLP